MRVIAGSHKGRILHSPRGNLIRPTSDRIKKFIFDYVAKQIHQAAVLDLFSGSGNLTIEALSRGAAKAVAVDKSKEAIQLIYRNLELASLLSQCQVVHLDVFRFLKIATKHFARFDLIFADPPYAANIYNELIDAIGRGDYLQDGGLFVLEHDARRFLESPSASLAILTKKIFGDSAILIFKKEGS